MRRINLSESVFLSKNLSGIGIQPGMWLYSRPQTVHSVGLMVNWGLSENTNGNCAFSLKDFSGGLAVVWHSLALKGPSWICCDLNDRCQNVCGVLQRPCVCAARCQLLPRGKRSAGGKYLRWRGRDRKLTLALLLPDFDLQNFWTFLTSLHYWKRRFLAQNCAKDAVLHWQTKRTKDRAGIVALLTLQITLFVVQWICILLERMEDSNRKTRRCYCAGRL